MVRAIQYPTKTTRSFVPVQSLLKISCSSAHLGLIETEVNTHLSWVLIRSIIVGTIVTVTPCGDVEIHHEGW